jgi:hypothetical protein
MATVGDSSRGGEAMILDPESVRRVAQAAPVFVAGAPRSGTTLIQLLLDSHPKLSVAYECDFLTDVALDPRLSTWTVSAALDKVISHRTFSHLGIEQQLVRELVAAVEPRSVPELLRVVLAARAVATGKPRWGNKTPKQVFYLPALARLFPDARFVHVVRDGRQVSISRNRLDGGRSSLLVNALLWREAVRAGRAAGERLGSARYLELRLESVAAEPDVACKALCAFIGLEWDPTMMRYHESALEHLPGDQRTLHPHVTEPPTSRWTDHQSIGSRQLALLDFVLAKDLTSLGYLEAPPPSLARTLVAGARLWLSSAAAIRSSARPLVRHGARRIGSLVQGRRGTELWGRFKS